MEYDSKSYALLLKEDKRHFQEVVRFLNPRREDRILEVGCSRGFLTRAMQDIAPETTGIDINPEAVRQGVARNLRVMSAEHLEFQDSSFDKIYSFHTIEHIPNLNKALREMERVLVPGGRMLLVYPAEPIQGLFAILSAILLFKNPFKAREIHVRKLFPKRLQEMLEGTKLEHEESHFSLLSIPQYFTVLRKKLV